MTWGYELGPRFASVGKRLMFSAAVMKVMMVSGTLNPTVYAISVRHAYPAFGILWGSLLSFGISLISTYFVYLFVQRKVT